MYIKSKPPLLLTPNEVECVKIHLGEKYVTGVPIVTLEPTNLIVSRVFGYSSFYVINNRAADNETFEIFLAIDQRMGLMPDAEYVKVLLEHYAFDILFINKLVKVRILVEIIAVKLSYRRLTGSIIPKYSVIL